VLQNEAAKLFTSAEGMSSSRTKPLTSSGAPVKMRGKNFVCSAEDVIGDGLKDLLCQVENRSQLTKGSTLAILTGQTSLGKPIQGSRDITVFERP
jgi:hypothetical protein